MIVYLLIFLLVLLGAIVAFHFHRKARAADLLLRRRQDDLARAVRLMKDPADRR